MGYCDKILDEMEESTLFDSVKPFDCFWTPMQMDVSAHIISPVSNLYGFSGADVEIVRCVRIGFHIGSLRNSVTRVQISCLKGEY